MVKEETVRQMERELTAAGWRTVRNSGRHTVYGCSHGSHTTPVPTTHRMVTPGVVRSIRKSIAECQGGHQ